MNSGSGSGGSGEGEGNGGGGGPVVLRDWVKVLADRGHPPSRHCHLPPASQEVANTSPLVVGRTLEERPQQRIAWFFCVRRSFGCSSRLSGHLLLPFPIIFPRDFHALHMHLLYLFLLFFILPFYLHRSIWKKLGFAPTPAYEEMVKSVVLSGRIKAPSLEPYFMYIMDKGQHKQYVAKGGPRADPLGSWMLSLGVRVVGHVVSFANRRGFSREKAQVSRRCRRSSSSSSSSSSRTETEKVVEGHALQ